MAFIFSSRPRPSWVQVLFNFSPVWFTACMGTGAMQQLFFNFPYPMTRSPQWMQDLGFCFWALDIVLFSIFLVLLLLRYVRFPKLLKKTIVDFPSCSYLGAIPIAFDTIVQGTISYYGQEDVGKWVAFALFWIAVVITIVISFGLLLHQMTGSRRHSFDDIGGLWAMTVVPVVIAAAVGANLCTQFSERVNVLMMIVTLLLWVCGLVLFFFILMCYFWRLISLGLPSATLIPSSFLPLAPLSQAASSGLKLSIAASSYIQTSSFTPGRSDSLRLSPDAATAIAVTIHWAGIIACLSLLAQASFWLVQATIAISLKRPKIFSLGMWSLTFPYASYTLAWMLLARDLRSYGMAWFAAANCVVVAVIWLLCAGATVWTALVTGQMFLMDQPVEESKTAPRKIGPRGGVAEDKESDYVNGWAELRKPSEITKVETA